MALHNSRVKSQDRQQEGVTKVWVGISSIANRHTKVLGVFPTKEAGEKYVCDKFFSMEKYFSISTLKLDTDASEMQVVVREYLRNGKHDRIINLMNSKSTARIIFLETDSHD